MEPAALRTERLSLSAPDVLDAPALALACSSGEDILRVLNKRAYTEDDAEDYILRAKEGWQLGSRYTWLLRAQARVLGQVSLDLKGHAESAVIGYWLIAEARGRGLLTEAGSEVLRWAFDPAGGNLSRIIWAAYEWNESSGKLAQRLGFQPAGTREAGELGWNFRGRAKVAHLDRS